MPSVLISNSSRTRFGWMIPARWKTVAPSAPAQRRPDRGRVADVALHELHVGIARSYLRLIGARQHERSHALEGAALAPFAGRSGCALVQEVHEAVAEPAGITGDER